MLGDLGASGESRRQTTAVVAEGLDDVPALNLVAVECVPAGTPHPGFGPGLPDDAYENDGQLTKRDLRASALSRLAPVPGELLWDLGAGAGSIAIEWARTDPRCRAIAVDRTPDRAARITANAARLGVPGIQVITADVVESLDWLPQPERRLRRRRGRPGPDPPLLAPAARGGRLVAHAVTIETEHVLLEAWRGFGGELVRIAVERLEPLGGFAGWKPARAVVQSSATRDTAERLP